MTGNFGNFFTWLYFQQNALICGFANFNDFSKNIDLKNKVNLVFLDMLVT